MNSVTVDRDRIKAIRKSRKIGRPKLAKLAGLTERQIAKIETDSAPVVAENLLVQVSDALHVPVQTLTGEFPLIAEDLEPASAKKCTSGCCG
ncbi:XRE family transcriptional regulator [Tateyamaria sp. syn59]|uniref:XRE family transcriptional regulator n=1 Tax=Tateyamaria sp. syn59 TaxID=2576942 RepID=UPI0011BD4A87|nr:XRE family transcriptional regulator [Tateyamaria sp. syn59]